MDVDGDLFKVTLVWKKICKLPASGPVFGRSHVNSFLEIVIELGSVFISQSIGDLSDGKPRGRQESGGFLAFVFVAAKPSGCSLV